MRSNAKGMCLMLLVVARGWTLGLTPELSLVTWVIMVVSVTYWGWSDWRLEPGGELTHGF